MPEERPICGAKTRSGKPCQTRPMPNGRCRMHGGTNPGAPKGNQNARKHGVWSVLLTEQDKEFLATDPKERLATLQALAELRAFRAHQAASGKVTDATLDVAFARNANQAANLARTRLALAEAAAEGVHVDEDLSGNEDGTEAVTEDERTARLARLLDTGATAGTGDAAGPPDVATGEPAADRGAA